MFPRSGHLPGEDLLAIVAVDAITGGEQVFRRDPATRLPAATAGHAQGAATASTMAALWQKP